MIVSEEALLKSGFTHTDLKKLKNYLIKNELTLDLVIGDLSKRFQAAIGLTAAILVAYAFVLTMASRENVISVGIALLVALAIIWFFQPPILAYKAWTFRRKYNRGIAN
ncbi:hypothetical protein GCM10023078_44110 [Gibbsiella greigii]